MREGLVEKLLDAALARHRSARRWSAILLVVAAWLHLLVLLPYARTAAERTATETRLAEAQGALRAFERTQARIEEARRASGEALAALTGRLIAELRQGFADLEAARAMIRGAPLVQPAAPPLGWPPDPDAPPPFPAFPPAPPVQAGPGAWSPPWPAPLPFPPGVPSPIQAPLPGPGTGVPALPPAPGPIALAALEDPEARAALVGDDAGAARARLQPFVEARIVAPAYERLNHGFAELVAPGLREAVAALRALPAAAPAEETLQKLEQVAGRRLEPPTEPYWWASVEGKGGAGLLVSLAYKRASDALGQTTELVSGLVERTVREQADRLAAQKAELDRLQGRLDAQLATLGEIARPLGAIRLELAGVLGWAPAALGLLLAGLLLWRADVRRELALLARWTEARAAADDPDLPWLAGWLAAAAPGRAERLVPALAAVLGGAWILALARGLAPAGGPGLPWAAGLGLAALLASAVLAARPAPVPPPRSSADA